MKAFENLGNAIYGLRNETCKGITYITGRTTEVFVSYSQLYNRSLSILHGLQAKGVQPGKILVLQLEDNETFIYFFWACILGGIIPVPLTAGYNHESMLKLFSAWDLLETPSLICSRSFFEKISRFAEQETRFRENFARMSNRTLFTGEFDDTVGQGRLYNAGLDDTVFIQFSSGSTGRPKGIVLTHNNVLSNINTHHKVNGIGSEDILLSWMPLTHDMGLNLVHISGVIAGVDQYLMPTHLFVRAPVLWIDKAHAHKATRLFSPNFGLKYFLKFYKPDSDYGWDLSCVRSITNGAEPIALELCVRFLDVLAKYGLKQETMIFGYGLAEATIVVSMQSVGERYHYLSLDRRFLKIGQPVRLVEETDRHSILFADEGYFREYCRVRICDDKDNPLAENVIGHIQVKGSNVMSGYYRNPEATREAYSRDGWLRTGDLGLIREDRLVVTGRTKEIIFVNARNYYPHDIEKAAQEAAGGRKILQAAACGIYSGKEQRDEVVLFIVFKLGLEKFIDLAEQIKKYILAKTGLRLDYVIPVNSIPKTTSGKLQRYLLAEKYRDGGFEGLIREMEEMSCRAEESGEGTGLLASTIKTLRAIYKKVFTLNQLGNDDDITEYGGDSILLVQAVREIDKVYPGKVTIANLFAYPTLNALAEFIMRDDNTRIPALIKIPADYFNAENYGQDTHYFQTRLGQEIRCGLAKIAGSASLEVSDILLSLYIFLLKEISGAVEIPVQVLVDGENALQMEIDFNTIEDYADFFRLVALKFRTGSDELLYPLKNTARLRLYKDKWSIIPFFCKKGILRMDIRLIDIYDIVFEIDEGMNDIGIICEYNNIRLKKERVKELFNQYTWLVSDLVKKYNTQ